MTCRKYEEVADGDPRHDDPRRSGDRGGGGDGGRDRRPACGRGQDLDAQVETICDTLAKTRPTAVNLFWAIDRMKRLYTIAARPADRGDPRAADRRSADRARGRYRDQSRDRAPRRAAGAGRQDGADALQRGRAGDGRVRHGAGRDPRGDRERARRSTCSPTRRGRSCRARG